MQTQTNLAKPGGAFASATAGALAPQNKKNLAIPEGQTDDGGIPYISFANGKMKAWDEMKSDIPTLKPADVTLHTKSTGFQKLDPLVFSVLELSPELWVERNTLNKVVTSTTKRQDFKDKRKQEFNALVLVYTPTGVVPALAQFRTAIADLGETARIGMNKVGDVEKWKAASPEHLITMKIPDALANLRFTVSARTYAKTFQSGDVGIVAKGKVKPVTAGQADQLAAFLNEPGNADRINRMRTLLNKRIEETTAAIKD